MFENYSNLFYHLPYHSQSQWINRLKINYKRHLSWLANRELNAGPPPIRLSDNESSIGSMSLVLTGLPCQFYLQVEENYLFVTAYANDGLLYLSLVSPDTLYVVWYRLNQLIAGVINVLLTHRQPHPQIFYSFSAGLDMVDMYVRETFFILTNISAKVN